MRGDDDDTTPGEWELSRAEKRWDLTRRRPSVQRKHAQHASHLPSRTLAGVDEDVVDGDHRVPPRLAYATLRAHRQKISPAESQAMKIVSHMEKDDELMLDDPISEQLRLEKLRDIPNSLTVKRSIKAKLTTSVNESTKKRRPIGVWKRLKYRISMSYMKVGVAMHELASSIEIWYHLIKAIEGHFGSGVASYFKFLRWLFNVNVLSCVLGLGFIVAPQCLNSIYTTTSFNGLDILTGSGFFTNTIMYYGFYTNETVSLGSAPPYSIPVAYFMTLFCCYVFTFLLLSIKVARSYRKSFIETAGGLTNVYASKIFCGWDFGIASYRAAKLRSATIYGELKELLGESRKRTEQDCSTKCYVLFIQSAMTILVVTIMSCSGWLLWKLLNQYEIEDTSTILTLVIPIVITAIMNVYPAFFSWLVKFEGYASERTALFITLLRTYVMEVVVLGVLLAFWLSKKTAVCWQTAFSQEIYRLIVIDFIISILAVFIAQWIRSKLYVMSCKKMGAPRFDIARNTLNLIYNQTLFWIAFYFSPPMSLVIVVKLILTFYIKSYGVLSHCEPPSRSWRAAQTQTLFLALAFLSLVGVLFVIGFVLTSVETQDCGPFRGYDYTWEMVVQGVLQLQEDSQFWVIIARLTRPGVGAGILIAMCVAVYYLRAKAYARREMVEILRGMLVLEATDKEFLLTGISRVTDKQWLYHLNPLLTPRPNLPNSPQHNDFPDSSRPARTYVELHTGTPRPSASGSVFHGRFDENSGSRYRNHDIELSERTGDSSGRSSTHNSIKSQDAKEGHQYNFMY